MDIIQLRIKITTFNHSINIYYLGTNKSNWLFLIKLSDKASARFDTSV